MRVQKTGRRWSALVWLGLSACCAAGASVVVWKMIEKITEVPPPPETVTVIVAARGLAQGHAINMDDLRYEELPPDYVPNAVLREPVMVIDRVARERILAGEMIREERLANPAAGGGLPTLIPTGMRAISVNLMGGASVAGFIEPGNYVDVLTTVEGDRKGNEPETTTLLQAVRVLAVDTKMGRGGEEHGPSVRPSVTLVVTPEKAETLTHAVSIARVALTLRNDIDVTGIVSHGAHASDLLGSPKTRVAGQLWEEVNEVSKDGGLLVIRGPSSQRE